MALYIIVSLLIASADQVTKLCAAHYGKTRVLIENVLSLTYVENRGAAFGMLQGGRVFFILITAAFFIGGGIYFSKNPVTTSLGKTAVAFIAGGALGNLIDRAVLGYVRDFICTEFIDFPVFNIADCFVCAGAALFVIYALSDEKTRDDNG